MLKRFAAYYKPHRFLFLLDMFVAVLASGLSITVPRITHRLLGIHIPARDAKAIGLTLGLILFVYVAGASLTFIRIK